MITEHSLWVLLHPSKDLSGVWVAHCLDLDIVTQGEGFQGAADALLEAVVMTVEDDIDNGADPFARERAPEQDWDRLYNLMKNPARVQLSSVPLEQRNALALVATQMRLVVNAHVLETHSDEMLMPEPWMIAARSSSIPGCHPQ